MKILLFLKVLCLLEEQAWLQVLALSNAAWHDIAAGTICARHIIYLGSVSVKFKSWVFHLYSCLQGVCEEACWDRRVDQDCRHTDHSCWHEERTGWFCWCNNQDRLATRSCQHRELRAYHSNPKSPGWRSARQRNKSLKLKHYHLNLMSCDATAAYEACKYAHYIVMNKYATSSLCVFWGLLNLCNK